jgi:hypothetical protein
MEKVLTFDKDNIMRIDFVNTYGSTYKVDMTALFNKTKISESEVQKIIEVSSIAGNNPNVIIITKEQYENVFFKKCK